MNIVPDIIDKDAPAPEKTVAPQGHNKWYLSQMSADIIAGVSSIAAGGVTAWRLIKELAHRNTSAIHFIEDIKDTRKGQGPDIAKKLEAGLISSDEAYAALQKSIQWNANKVDERMGKAGASSIFRKFGLLRPHQKWEVAVTTLATGGIALGSILLLSRGVFSQKEEQELADKGNTQAKDDKTLTM